MNYFAHGYRFVDDPYFAAGTALPDWLGVVDRRVRLRPQQAREAVQVAEPPVDAVVRGVLQHFHDDGWFHCTRAFAELNWQLTVLVRSALADDDSLRPSFLGHILIEILLDAQLIAEMPEALEAYYRAIGRVEGGAVRDAVLGITGTRLDEFGRWIGLFVRERFLCDYADDRRLLFRLNQVMRRVNLEELPPTMLDVLPAARDEVSRRRDELLTPNASETQP